MKKLKKILLINWSYFSKEIIELGSINFLTGKNRAGKSTIIDALQVVLLGETDSGNFNRAAFNKKSERTVDGYLRADKDPDDPRCRRGKDFSSYIACEYQDDREGISFVTGVVFDSRSDGSRQEHFFIYIGTLPENGFVKNGEAMDSHELRQFLAPYSTKAEIYDRQKEYRRNLLSRWNVHNEQVFWMLKKAVCFEPNMNIQKFITENICDISEKIDIEDMQQNIRDYKRHELLAQQQEEKLAVLQEICGYFQKMNDSFERWRVHSFLVQWAEKVIKQSEIDKLENERQDCLDEKAAAEKSIEELSSQIERDEARRRQLDLARENNDIYKEQRALDDCKQALKKEQESLRCELQASALEIKAEACRLDSLCKDVLEQETEEALRPAFEAAENVRKAYSVFTSEDYKDYKIFSLTTDSFAAAQRAVAAFSNIIQSILNKVEARIEELNEKNRENARTLLNLQKNIKDYPKGLLQLKDRLTRELERQTGSTMQVDILCDVLEILDERWRGAVEGYLHTQKFYLLVEPTHYKSALSIFDGIKKEFGYSSFGIVDVGKLRERETINARVDSLAGKVVTENKLARSYIDYLLGCVVCCETAAELRNFKTAITAEGILYQDYAARLLQNEHMRDAFIGQRAIALRISRLEEEQKQVAAELCRWSPVRKLLTRETDPLFTARFVQSDVAKERAAFRRDAEITEQLCEIDDKLSKLDLLWLNEQQKAIDALGEEIRRLSDERNEKSIQIGQCKERIRQLQDVEIPNCQQQLAAMEESLQKDFKPEYRDSIGLPRYQQELDRLKSAKAIFKNFGSQKEKSNNEFEAAREALFTSRRRYAELFKACSFRIETMDNEEYEAERKLLEESELPKYREKIKRARESAMEQFQNDFLAKLKSSIDQVQDQVKSLNRTLRQAHFGTDTYQFRVERNPDYAEYYDMIMDPELMEGNLGLFAVPFQDKYGPVIEKLFSQITMADDTQMNKRKQSELQENIERYTDFRTYLKFDMETTNQNGHKELLSQTWHINSGGEIQTPFYVAVLAAFAQLYRVNDNSSFGNTVRLVVLDEAFNKMDSERIRESIRILRELGLQAIIATPPDKAEDIMRLADCTLLAINDGSGMHIKPFRKEMSK